MRFEIDSVKSIIAMIQACLFNMKISINTIKYDLGVKLSQNICMYRKDVRKDTLKPDQCKYAT